MVTRGLIAVQAPIGNHQSRLAGEVRLTNQQASNDSSRLTNMTTSTSDIGSTNSGTEPLVETY